MVVFGNNTKHSNMDFKLTRNSVFFYLKTKFKNFSKSDAKSKKVCYNVNIHKECARDSLVDHTAT